MKTSLEERARLREIAEAAGAASSHRWRLERVVDVNPARVLDESGGEVAACWPDHGTPRDGDMQKVTRQIAEHVAAFDPETVTKLLDDADEAGGDKEKTHDVHI